MRKIIYSLFLIFILFPISSGFSQGSDLNKSALTVSLTSNSPFIYKDEQGYTIVVGAVENKNELTSVTNIRIVANFYDNSSSQPLEIAEGGTIMVVIPPLETSPYMIKSKTPNSSITQADVHLQSFDSSISKSNQLTIKINDVVLDEKLHFSGILKNGAAPITNTNIHIAFYDVFQPARIVSINTIPIGSIDSNGIKDFSFNEKIDKRAVGFQIFSESDIFYSDKINVRLPDSKTMTKFVTISDVSITDLQGLKLSEVKVGSPVKIQADSWIQFSADQKSDETPYSYYAQIKQSGKTPYVEFLGKSDGKYIGAGKQIQTVEWVPKHEGLYFIETFVWDQNNIPIADKGPVVLVVVN
jgi:hypothetical protein